MSYQIGEIKTGRELGFFQGQTLAKFIWLECPSCHNCRWVSLYLHNKAEKENRVLKCKECNGREQGRISAKRWNSLDE